MPRPSKRVSPETLGGRIRAARQSLQLSLAEVAKDHYSTSLISQIERNKVDPSQDSLQFLAERLKLPLKELTALSQQSRATETEEHKYKTYEDLCRLAAQLLNNNQPRKALERLATTSIDQLPPSLRWRFYALHGECYFKLRQFLLAQRDLLVAMAALPVTVAPDQQAEAVALQLHLAVATRELGQIKFAYEQLKDVLAIINVNTPLFYVAETHWELALVVFELSNNASPASEDCPETASCLQHALEHAETAYTLYRSVNETLRASLLECQMGIIEQARGHLDAASVRLRSILDIWASTLEETTEHPSARRYKLKERANAVSAAACYLATIELQLNHCEAALAYAETALAAGEKSYILRQAEAQMTYGSILAKMDLYDPRAEAAFRKATDVLAQTDRIAAKIKAHFLLAAHLMAKGDTAGSQKEQKQVSRLSNIPTTLSSEATSDIEENVNG